MVAAGKAESETEDTKEKVKAQSPVATEVSDGSNELANQIAQLMAALNRTEQGTCHASAPNSLRPQGSQERADRQEYSCLPQLPQWSDWPGPKHFGSQLFHCK